MWRDLSTGKPTHGPQWVGSTGPSLDNPQQQSDAPGGWPKLLTGDKIGLKQSDSVTDQAEGT